MKGSEATSKALLPFSLSRMGPSGCAVAHAFERSSVRNNHARPASAFYHLDPFLAPPLGQASLPEKEPRGGDDNPGALGIFLSPG